MSLGRLLCLRLERNSGGSWGLGRGVGELWGLKEGTSKEGLELLFSWSLWGPKQSTCPVCLPHIWAKQERSFCKRGLGGRGGLLSL